MLTVKELRKSYIDFFAKKGHKIVPSSSLVPQDDPTLLFTTAGMVQFKPMFAGTVALDYTRAASIQRCLRTSDLENVGRTKRHMTLFEMLGNFSFGDYFKKEAIEYAWEYSTKVIGFKPESIWVSIYEDDDEAFEIWNKTIGIPAEKIVRLGKADNFWGPAGDSGACGPCSELYLDRGPAYSCGSPDCKPGCDCERYLEYWNLVFNQFNQDINGTLHPLPRTGIDTGMGLERLATLVQGVDSVYQTDELQTLIAFVCKERSITYENETIVPINVIIEHARALTFAMSDGIYPSNDGRGYVLRRILRRALRFCRQLGINEPFIHRLVDPIVDIMGEFYPELPVNAGTIKTVIESEEKRFLETIEKGMERLESTIARLRSESATTFPGDDAFILYDTFGFPLEMTTEIAREQGLAVDIDGFNASMENQRQRGKESWKGADSARESVFNDLAKKAGDSRFTGYESTEEATLLVAVASSEKVTGTLKEGERGYFVLEATPFYGESGGQVGDQGLITSAQGAVFAVEDTRKTGKTVIHLGSVTRGSFSEKEKVTASIDVIRRNLTRANHTATHLLQAALKSVVGEHVRQAGSMVSPDRLRFDFSHFSSLNDVELAKIESIVNEKIWENIAVRTDIMQLDDAVKDGAVAVFDEKYEDTVRVLTVGGFSKELCGGTHVSSTGEIGLFKIIRESSPGAGMRRIEAQTLKGILDRYTDMESVIGNISATFNVPEADLVKKAAELAETVKSLEKELAKLKKQNLSTGIDAILQGGTTVKGITVISHIVKDAGIDELRDLADAVRSRLKDSVALLASNQGDAVTLLFAATKSAVEKGIHCGAMIKECSPLVGGGGGGRPDMAQAGGKNAAGMPEALAKAVDLCGKIKG